MNSLQKREVEAKVEFTIKFMERAGERERIKFMEKAGVTCY